ncbi:hypothetical protein B296_00048323 [Ensete ventricosum]|uniref:Uncharacterized protein n=1 Tax=Ensete ventricosum TaxID=4639 RepID=A0A426YCP9_ENSVE|nr:hypothetical protein B296_00048323 [Ensete ventricosum]
MAGFMGAFWGTRALEIVKRNNSPGLLWKRIKLTTTRKNNAKKRLRRVWQVTPHPAPQFFPISLGFSIEDRTNPSKPEPGRDY